jgi:hypothetical protein
VAESPHNTEQRTPEPRGLVAELAAVLVCAWTGYFLGRGWADAEPGAALLVCSGAVVAAAGAMRVARDAAAPNAPTAAVRSPRVGLVAVAVGSVAVTLATPYGAGVLPAGALVLAVLCEHCGRGGAVARRFAFGALAGAGAVGVGLTAAGAWEPAALGSAAALAGYVGFACAARTPGISRQTFLALTFLMIATAIVIGAVGFLYPAYWMLSALFAAWAALRLGLIAREVAAGFERYKVQRFAEEALLGAGLVAGALLVLKVGASARAGDPKVLSEMTWPVLAGAFSLLMMRAWPFLWRRRETSESGSAGGAAKGR